MRAFPVKKFLRSSFGIVISETRLLNAGQCFSKSAHVESPTIGMWAFPPTGQWTFCTRQNTAGSSFQSCDLGWGGRHTAIRVGYPLLNSWVVPRWCVCTRIKEFQMPGEIGRWFKQRKCWMQQYSRHPTSTTAAILSPSSRMDETLSGLNFSDDMTTNKWSIRPNKICGELSHVL